MKKIININLSGRLIPIEDSAYELLKSYLDSLKRYFADEEGRDEILGDIESRIAEICQERLKKGAHCITDEDINTIIAAMGRPEQFDDDEPASSRQGSGPDKDFARRTKPRKRLYRDPDDKILGGVCSGLAAYFGIDPIIFRLIFALLLFGAGTGVLLYVILWIATPEARTSAEKLEMRGERVDLQNISNTVKEEMGHIKSRMEHIGSDIRDFSYGRGREIGTDLGYFLRNLIRGLADILVFIAKGFLYFLGVVILIALIGAIIFLTGSSVAVFPLTHLMLDGFLQNMLFWPSLILLIGIPVIALIIFVIRRLAGIKYTHHYVGYALFALWMTGVICAAVVIISLVKDFSMKYRETAVYPLVQPAGGQLVVKPAADEVRVNGFDWFEGNLNFTEDTAFIRNVRIRIERSAGDSFKVEIVKIANGRTVAVAARSAGNIRPVIYQQDTVLYIDPIFALNIQDKFRDQRVLVKIKVPVNKTIQIDEDRYQQVSWSNEEDDDGGYRYRMTPSGPKKLKGPGDEQLRSARYNYRDIPGTDGLSYLFYSIFNLVER